jgi:hypothetical protein
MCVPFGRNIAPLLVQILITALEVGKLGELPSGFKTRHPLVPPELHRHAVDGRGPDRLNGRIGKFALQTLEENRCFAFRVAV